jgi:hypothetical protein
VTAGSPIRCATRNLPTERQRSEARWCATRTHRPGQRSEPSEQRPSGPARARGAVPERQTTRATASTLTNASPRGIGQIRQAATDMPASGRALSPPAVRLDRAQRGLDRSLCSCREDAGGRPTAG